MAIISMRDRVEKIRSSWARRIAWLIGIWVGSVVALALVAWLLRLFMNWAGMTAGHF